MSDKRQWIPITGLIATMAIVVYTVIQLQAQGSVPPTGDFTQAAVAEVRDVQGQVLLRGSFVLVDEPDDDIERKATLVTVGADTDATGEAEVEFSKAAPVEQEIEFAVKNVEPGIRLVFVIDGREIASVTADKKGEAEFEDDIEMPPAGTGGR